MLGHSRNPDELRHVWVEWRRATGEQVRSSFEHYVALSNEAARLNSKSYIENKRHLNLAIKVEFIYILHILLISYIKRVRYFYFYFYLFFYFNKILSTPILQKKMMYFIHHFNKVLIDIKTSN